MNSVENYFFNHSTVYILKDGRLCGSSQVKINIVLEGEQYKFDVKIGKIFLCKPRNMGV